MLDHMFQYQSTTEHQLQQKNYAQKAAFPLHCMGTPSPDSILLRQMFCKNVFFTSQDSQSKEQSYFGHKSAKRVTKYELHNKK